MSGLIDIYASVDMDIWKAHRETIMAFSIDGVNYHDNTCRESEDEEWNLNIRIDEDDLEAIDRYVEICNTQTVEDE